MIKMPFILLINCVGSYLYSIMEHLSKENDVNGMLYYLAQSELKFKYLSMNEILDKYKENPWGYQPIKIVDHCGDNLEINDSCFEFLYKYFHIESDRIDAEKIDLMELFLSVDYETSFLVCTVDEMYLKNSAFYEKKHNKHFLLIKSMNFIENTVDIIDSEQNRIFTLKFDEIKKAIINSSYKRKIIYRIDGRKYESNVDNQILEGATIKNGADYFDEWITDIVNKKNDEIFEFEYYFCGYYYNIISKIIPYYFTCAEIHKSSVIEYEFYQNIIVDWRNLTKYMKLGIYRKNMDDVILIRKIEKIRNKFQEVGLC